MLRQWESETLIKIDYQPQGKLATVKDSKTKIFEPQITTRSFVFFLGMYYQFLIDIFKLYISMLSAMQQFIEGKNLQRTKNVTAWEKPE